VLPSFLPSLSLSLAFTSSEALIRQDIVLALSTSLEVFRPDFILAISASIEVFSLLSCLFFPLLVSATHLPWIHRRIWDGFWIQVFKLRSTSQLLLRCVTRLSAVKSVAFRLHQHHLISVRPSLPWSVSCTRQWVFHTHQRVTAPPPPQLSPAATDGGFLLSATSTAGERSTGASAWSTRAGAGAITAEVCCHTVVGSILSLFVYIAGLDLCARSWPGKHRYFEVLKSYVFQLRSINFRGPLHHTLHTIGFSACSPSIHCQLLRLQILTSHILSSHQHRFHAVVILSLLICNKFNIFCIYFVCGWVSVSLVEPTFIFLDLKIAVPIPFHPLQRGCYFFIQISTRPSLSTGLFRWTGLKAFAWVMPLFSAGLVLSSPGANRSLILFKVDRAGTFSIPLELETHHSLLRYYLGIVISDWSLLPFYFLVCLVCNICFLLSFGMSRL
jgi:hypothetical protein